MEVERETIRCVVCDKLLAKNEDREALAEFYNFQLVACKECYEKYFKEVTGEKKTHGVLYQMEGHYKEGDKIPDEMWIILRSC